VKHRDDLTAAETPQPDTLAEPEPTGLIGVDAEPLPPPSREEIEALRRERDELRDQLLRRRAEFENYRKRVERDKQQATLDTGAALFRSLVPTLDNLERALRSDGSDAALRNGVELIRKDLLALLESQGVVSLDPLGQKFDPNTHQALSHEAVAGFAEDTVVEVFGKGYFYKDRLLRPAIVKVAKGPEPDPGDAGESEEVH
jgi:molecular chaperone GrpE